MPLLGTSWRTYSFHLCTLGCKRAGLYVKIQKLTMAENEVNVLGQQLRTRHRSWECTCTSGKEGMREAIQEFVLENRSQSLSAHRCKSALSSRGVEILHSCLCEPGCRLGSCKTIIARRFSASYSQNTWEQIVQGNYVFKKSIVTMWRNT
jgi:hypothetical protein